MRTRWVKTTEVAHFQAEEVDIPWEYFAQANHFDPNSFSEKEYMDGFVEDLPEYVQQQIKDDTIPVNRWKAFNTQTFPWHIESNLDIHGYTEFLINGERQFVTKPDLKLSKYPSAKAAPAWYRMYFKKDGVRYKAILIFSQNNPDMLEMPDGDLKIFNIFKEYFTTNPNESALFIDIVDGQLVAYLTDGNDDTQDVRLPLDGSYFRPIEDDKYLWFK